MRQEFLNIVHQLKNNQYYAISIVDDTTMNKILSTTLGSTLIAKYGSVENYFEQLKNSGVTSFTIQEYKKNGSGWKNTGNVVRNLTFSDKNTAVNPVQVYTPPAVQIMPLNGANNQNQQVVGLGFYEAANLMASSHDKVRLEEENKYLKTNNEELKKLVDELKEERLKTQYDTAGKATQNEMIMGLVQNLPAILNGFKSTAPAPALNAPAQNVSEIKAQMIAYLSEPTTSDALVHFISQVVSKLTTDATFAEQLDNMLNTQKQN